MSISRARQSKFFFAAFALLFPLSTLAQSVYVYPAAVIAPRGSYQTITAVVDGVNDKTVTWTASGGTLVGTNPCVVNEPCTIALYTTAAGTYTVTATSDANPGVAASSTVTVTNSPTPAVTHPRLGGITAAMLPGLQAKAVSSNPMYATLYNEAVATYTADNAIWSWSCNGGSGQPSSDHDGELITKRMRISSRLCQ